MNQKQVSIKTGSNIIEALQHMEEICRRALEVENDKTGALLARRGDDLQRLTEQSEALLGELELWEKQRLMAMDVIEMLEAEQDNDFLQARRLLKESYHALKLVLDRNMALLEQNRAFFEEMVGVLAVVEKSNTYRADGDRSNRDSDSRPLLVNVTM